MSSFLWWWKILTYLLSRIWTSCHWHRTQIKETLRHKSREHDLWKIVWVADVYISTESFLLPIPVSDWLIFCCGNLIVFKKRNENDKQINFEMKNNPQNKKCLKIICVHIVGFFILLNSRSSRPEVFCKKGALKYFVKFNRPGSFLIKLQALVSLLKKRLWYRYFPGNFTKFLRAHFL